MRLWAVSFTERRREIMGSNMYEQGAGRVHLWNLMKF